MEIMVTSHLASLTEIAVHDPVGAERAGRAGTRDHKTLGTAIITPAIVPPLGPSRAGTAADANPPLPKARRAAARRGRRRWCSTKPNTWKFPPDSSMKASALAFQAEMFAK